MDTEKIKLDKEYQEATDKISSNLIAADINQNPTEPIVNATQKEENSKVQELVPAPNMDDNQKVKVDLSEDQKTIKDQENLINFFE